MTEIRYLDVCSGYSAFTLASAGLGFRCAGYSEIEPFPRAMLQQRHHAVAVDWDHRFAEGAGTTPLFGDFTRIEAHHVGPIDLLTGGTPCQAFSLAGLRGGLADARGNLTLEFLRLAERVRARWVLWENVPGVFSALAHDAPDPSPPAIDLDGDDGPEDGEEVVVEDEYDADESHALSCFLAGLSDLGYGWAYRVLDAQYVRVDGHERAVPQRRRRVFVVACLGDSAGPAAVLFEPESLRGDPAPRRETGEGIAGAVAPSLVSSGRGVERAGETRRQDPVVAVQAADVAVTLDASYGRLQGCSGQDANHGHSYLVAFGGNDTRGAIDVATARSAHGGPHGRLDFDSETFVAVPIAHAFDARQQDVCQYGDISPPLDTDGYTVGVAQPVYAIQERAVSENAAAGPDGVGVRGDGAAYTLEARSVTQAVAFDTTQITSAANFSNPKPGDACHPLARGQHPPAIAYSIVPMNSGKDYKARAVDVAQPLMAAGPVGGNQGGDYVADAWAVRRLTPTECERLMGVPDGFTAIEWRGKPAPDGPRYKVLGNSQSINQMRWIARGLADVIAVRRLAEME